MLSLCGKPQKPWLKKGDIFCIIEADLRNFRLCHNNKFDKRVSFFDHLRQKATSSSLIYYGLMKCLHMLNPLEVKTPKKYKVSPFMKIELHFKTFSTQRL